jgi:HSP20 family molecular chaperone IbpA
MNDQQVTQSTSDQPPARQKKAANGNGAASLLPPTDIYETKDAVIMLLDVPGADPETLNVTLEKRSLTISARAVIEEPEGFTPVYAEYQDGNYERSFTLSDEIDSDRIEAVFKDGVLKLNLPKMQTPAKKIAVKSA